MSADQIRLGPFLLDCLELDQIMERLGEMLENDYLNTVALLTRHLMLDAGGSEEKTEYLKRLDLGILDETELLETAGVTGGRVYEEVCDRIVIDRVFWQVVKRGLSVYLLSDQPQGGEHLKEFLLERYPGIRIVGETTRAPSVQSETDRLLNAVNGLFPDLIISGLDGDEQDRFLMQHQTKVFGKIWWSFCESPHLQAAAGIRKNWWEERRLKRAYRKAFPKQS